MATVHVGPKEIGPFDLRSIPSSEINRAISNRVADGKDPCIKVLFDEGPLSGWGVQTQNCGGGGGGGGTPSGRKQKILDVWGERVTSQPEVRGGQVTAFLKQIRGVV